MFSASAEGRRSACIRKNGRNRGGHRGGRFRKVCISVSVFIGALIYIYIYTYMFIYIYIHIIHIALRFDSMRFHLYVHDFDFDSIRLHSDSGRLDSLPIRFSIADSNALGTEKRNTNSYRNSYRNCHRISFSKCR